jgi:L-iditol 2-dehydrogenase
MSKRMLAARLEARNQVSCHAIPRPSLSGAAGEGAVLIESAVTTICGSDLHYFNADVGLASYPCPHGYPGHETVGTVVDSTTDLHRVGDVVLGVPDASCCAAFAEFQVLPARFVIPLPHSAPHEELVLAQQLGTVICALRRWGIESAGEVATVIGAGTAGIYFANRLKAVGYEQVVVSDLDPSRLERAASAGADVTVGADDVEAATMDLSGGRGADVVIEAAGYDVARAGAVACVRRRGFIGLFGLPESRGDAPFPMHDFFRKQAVLHATTHSQSEPGLRSFREAIGLIVTEAVPAAGLVTHAFPIDRIGDAILAAENRDGGVGKVAVSFS